MNVIEQLEFEEKWQAIEQMFYDRFGKKTDLEAKLIDRGIL
jgi:hypothetical protein